MYILYVSNDFGITYFRMDAHHDAAYLVEEARSKEHGGFRWYIEDDKGYMIEYCEVFKIAMDALVNATEEPPTMFATDDRVLARLLRDMGIHVVDSSRLFKSITGFDWKTTLH